MQGALIATSGNAASAFMVGESLPSRFLTGRVNSTGQTLRLEGEDPSGCRLRITAVRSQDTGEQQ